MNTHKMDDARALAVPLVQQTAPERIWLAVSEEPAGADEPFPSDAGEDICWSTDAPLAVCVPYVRADLAAPASHDAQRVDGLPPAAVAVESGAMSAGLMKSGDWAIPSGTGSVRVVDARMAYGWNQCREEMIERAALSAQQQATPKGEGAVVGEGSE